MKKFIAITLVALMAASIFAAPLMDPEELSGKTYEKVFQQFAPTDPRSLGMGGAGLALTESAASMFSNPASLAGGNAAVSIPSVGITVNHIYDILKKDGSGKSAVDKVMEEIDKGSDMELSNIVTELVNVIGSDHGSLLSVDASMAIRMKGGFGIGAYVTDSIKTYSTSGALASNLINQLNFSGFVGYGLGIDLDVIKLNFGASAKLNYLLLNKAISATDVLNGLSDEKGIDELILEQPIIYGYSIPVSFGISAEFPFGLKATAVVADMNNKLSMNVVEGQNFGDEPAITGIEMSIDPKMNFGVAFTTPGFLKATVAADFVDVTGYVKDMADGIEGKRALLSHLNAGAEFDVLNLLEARAGISQGYMSVGASFNLFVFRVDAAYYWKEMGRTTGQNPVDAFSLRFNLGWER